ncbi:uncharacterized protein LOC121055979 [Oryza brachyantha]|uniref:uncharacterized protein LOC121055979 n=1 Tax=Oryza brachyantha TaxID=4533 RepID=UPI001AD95F84|nr:uncharacterized protein LOC121055979 [Oryza brachyantha]
MNRLPLFWMKVSWDWDLGVANTEGGRAGPGAAGRGVGGQACGGGEGHGLLVTASAARRGRTRPRRGGELDRGAVGRGVDGQACGGGTLPRAASHALALLVSGDAVVVVADEGARVVALVRMLVGKGKAAMVADVMAEFAAICDRLLPARAHAATTSSFRIRNISENRC